MVIRGALLGAALLLLRGAMAIVRGLTGVGASPRERLPERPAERSTRTAPAPRPERGEDRPPDPPPRSGSPSPWDGATYALGQGAGGEDLITCRFCGLTSAHPEDVRNRYCGHCHLFHGARPALGAP